MYRSHLLAFAAIALVAVSCSPKVRTNINVNYPPQPEQSNVVVLAKKDSLPVNAEKLGKIAFADAGMTSNCDLPVLIYLAKKEARKVGGNLLRITEHKTPDAFSSCHRIKADIYRIDSLSLQQTASLNRTQLYSEKSYVPKEYDKWRWGFHPGYSYRIAKTNDQLTADQKDYINKLRPGPTFGLDVHHFVASNAGVGLRYDFNSYKHSMGTTSDRIIMHYIAASAVNRTTSRDQKSSLILGFSLGLQVYRDDVVAQNRNGLISGTTLGSGIEIGYDYKYMPGAALYLGFSVLTGTLKSIRVPMWGQRYKIKLDKDEWENLSRLQLSIGLRFGGKVPPTPAK